ncbi:MAG: hypothetical protein EPN30_01750 [Actinomycetota bacterium]|nr:MAG: hypothetical protein EPN30_01750 [Actinomycetota bacterium]
MRNELFNFIYQRWDGTQNPADLDGDEIFDEIRDSLLYHGDVAAALKKLLSEGFRDRHGNRTSGLKDMVERLAKRRREILSQHDPSGILQEISDALDEIVQTEQSAVNSKMDDLADKVDPSSQQARDRLNTKGLELSTMPNSPVSRMQSLKNYEFESPEAEQAFQELLERVYQQILDSFFHSMKRGLESQGQETVAQMREMLADLNSLLSDFREGKNTDAQFGQFMQKWGDNFPPGINSVEDLVDFLMAQMRATSAMFNSLSPDQRRELMELSQALMDDLDLGWQLSQLGDNLAPFMGPGTPRYGFHGDQPMSLGDAPEVFSELGELSDLETFLRQVSSPADLADVDLAQLENALGKGATEALERLAKVAASLEEAGLVANDESRMVLTPKGMRRIGESVLSELFSKGEDARLGDHALTRSGIGNDLEYETKPYEFGDPFNLNINKTIRNALLRSGAEIPVKVTPEDFEIEKMEKLSRASTVLLLDLSLSMPLRDNFLTAKKVALALHSLISTKYPKDSLSIVGFSEVARRIEPYALPEVSWDYVYGTNMEHALLMAREILRYEEGHKQIIMITDGEPTAHILPGGEVFFSYPSSPETIAATLKEVMRCTREDITINTFVLDATWELKKFMEKFASINKGRVFYTDPAHLGKFVLIDFLAQKSKSI